MKPLEFIKSFNNRGIWSFTFKEAETLLNKDPTNIIRFLLKKKRLFNPGRGFYAIIPEELSETGRLPMERYIDSLMKFYQLPYYVGLLSAAAHYGSSHQSPQVLQVIIGKPRRPIIKNMSKIVFFEKKSIEHSIIIQKNTPTGYMKISTPESTFFDLIKYNGRIGGLDRVYIVVSELMEQFTVSGLKKAARTFPIAIVQRGGYILEKLNYNKGKNALLNLIDIQGAITSSLNPSYLNEGVMNKNWRLIINSEIETED